MNNPIGPPATIELLLHIHCVPLPVKNADQKDRAQRIQFLLDEGAIVPSTTDQDRYFTTGLGSAWVSLLCATEAPTIAYLDKDGEIIRTKP